MPEEAKAFRAAMRAASKAGKPKPQLGPIMDDVAAKRAERAAQDTGVVPDVGDAATDTNASVRLGAGASVRKTRRTGSGISGKQRRGTVRNTVGGVEASKSLGL